MKLSKENKDDVNYGNTLKVPKDQMLADLKNNHNVFATQMNSIDYIDDAFPQHDKKVNLKNNNSKKSKNESKSDKMNSSRG